MPNTYYSNKVQLNAAGVNTVEPKWLPSGEITVVASFTLAASGQTLGVGDTIQLMDIPAGVTITGVTIDTGKLDSNGAPTVVFEVGDATVAGRFLSGSTIGKTGGVSAPNAAGGALGISYASTTRVFATITTAAATVSTATPVFTAVINYCADA